MCKGNPRPTVMSGSLNLSVKGRATIRSLQVLIAQGRLIGVPDDAVVNYITVHQSTIGGGSGEASWTLNWSLPTG